MSGIVFRTMRERRERERTTPAVDPVLVRMTEDERVVYEEARSRGYALLRAAHEVYMAAKGRDKGQ